MDKRKTEKDFTATREEIERLIKQFRELVDKEARNDSENTGLKNGLGELDRIKRMWSEKRFQVAVLALIKSGKSTLINAMLGAEYLPSSNTPETARIVCIRHEPTVVDKPVLEKANAQIATGVTEIRNALQSLNASQREADATPAEDKLTLTAPLVCLSGRSLGKWQFEVLDTPGPNEAGADILRERVDALLGEADVIIYLLDYSKLKTEEEKGLFARLSAMRPELLKQFSERLFFVVNKIDLENRSGLSQGETRQYVADLLSKQVSGLDIPQERVLLVSAEHGLLARIVESGEVSDEVRRDFAKRVFGVLGENVALEKCRDAAPRLLEQSKLGTLEENIISFIYKNRERVFLQGVVERLDNFHVKFNNGLCVMKTSLNAKRDELARKCRELENDLKVTGEEFAAIHSEAGDVANRVKQSVREQFSDFKNFVLQELDKAKEQKPSRFKRVKAFLSRKSDPVQDKKAANEQLEAANRTIRAELGTQFKTFDVELKQKAWEEQKKLFEGIKAKLQPLARRTEKVIGNALDVSLSPVQIEIPIPSLDEFVNQIQEDTDIVQTRTDTEREPVKKKIKVGDGWCREKYQVRWVEGTRVVKSHTVDHDALLKYWNASIEQMTEASVKMADRVIKKKIQAATRLARSEIEEYRKLYVDEMRRSLKVSEQGEAARKKRLEEVQTVSEELLKLKRKIEKCHEFLAAQA